MTRSLRGLGWLFAKPRGVHGWVSLALVVFGLAMTLALGMVNFNSQYLIEHRFWVDLLHGVSADHAARVRAGDAGTLPREGVLQSWYVEGDAAAPGLPPALIGLPAGDYSTEDGYGNFESLDAFKGGDAFHATIVDLPPGRLVTLIDVDELERQQNRDARWSTAWALVLALFIGGLIAWLHANLVRPIRDLADRMRAIEPGTPGARLPTTYKREEMQTIAQASNAHLERVEQFIARERSLLDQASHEFRTPIAVIAGALDVLGLQSLPDTAKPPLARISHAVGDLSETMVALLYLAREPAPGGEPIEITDACALLPRIATDHEHLLQGKSARLVLGDCDATLVHAPEAMLRIAIGNLVRNAIEHTETGEIRVALRDGVVSVSDSGSGFDPVEAARRYRDSLRHAAPVRGQGLGLFLIGRMCDRFGWRLSIAPGASGGTRATLDLRANLAPHDEA